MYYKFSDDLLQRTHDVFKQHYNADLSKEECDEILDSLAKLFTILTDEDGRIVHPSSIFSGKVKYILD